MAHHSVAEAKDHLSDLIERALKGEDVVITRHRTPVVELRPVQPPPRIPTSADVEWVLARRARWLKPGQDAVKLVRAELDGRDE